MMRNNVLLILFCNIIIIRAAAARFLLEIKCGLLDLTPDRPVWVLLLRENLSMTNCTE